MKVAKPAVRWWFYPVLLGVTLIVCLLVAEIAVRLTWAREYPRRSHFYQFNPDIGLIHIPGQHQLPFLRCLAGQPCEPTEVRFTVNQDGFRGPEFRQPVGQPLVAFIGDSQIEAQPVDDEQIVSAQTETLLKPKFSAVEVRNFSITSAGLVHYYATWSKFIVAQRPSVLVVFPIGANDFRNCSPKLETFPPMRPHYTFTPDGTRQVHFEAQTNNFSAAHRWLARQWDKLETVRFVRWLSAVRQEQEHSVQTRDGAEISGDTLIYEEPPPPDYAEAAALGQEYLQRLIREAQTVGTKVVVVALPARDEALDERWQQQETAFAQAGRQSKLNRQRPENLLRTIAQTNGATFVSFADAVHKLPASQQQTLWHVQNDVHLTAAGHRFLAETLAPVLEQILASSQ